MLMLGIFKRFLLTLSYMTILPINRNADSAEQSFNGLTKYLSAVGLLIGFILCFSFYFLCHLHTNNLLMALLIITLWLIITGAFHLDGLMDTADGIFSHTNQKRMLEIMHDSRVGNFGVITGIICLLTKFISLYSLLDLSMSNGFFFNHQSIYLILLFIPASARLAQSFTIGYFPYLRAEGKGKIWHDTILFPRDLWLATLLPAIVAAMLILLYPQQVFLITSVVALTVISGVIAAFLISKKLGGQTGDTYGAVVELAESGGLLFSVLALAALTLK